MQTAETSCHLQPTAQIVGSDRHPQTVPGNVQLELALAYARAGFAVFPVDPPTKAPRTERGHKDATADDARIRAWWGRWPNSLVAIPTGAATGLWVLDVDGEAGRCSLGELLALLGLEQVADLSPVIVETPSGGLHIYFCIATGEHPRTRASDIGPGLDTRGDGGYIVAPGNIRPDGRGYRHVAFRHDLAEASLAPRELIYLATFNARERALIADDAELSRLIRAAAPSTWSGILEAHRQRERERNMARIVSHPPDADAMRRQALTDLAEAVNAYAALADGRRNGLFMAACRLAKYVAHEVLTEDEVLAALEVAGSANGAAQYGRGWITNTIRRGLAYGANDPLPPLARKFREGLA